MWEGLVTVGGIPWVASLELAVRVLDRVDMLPAGVGTRDTKNRLVVGKQIGAAANSQSLITLLTRVIANSPQKSSV
jgi:hypothetical protein